MASQFYSRRAMDILCGGVTAVGFDTSVYCMGSSLYTELDKVA